jgi:hypothetical protein
MINPLPLRKIIPVHRGKNNLAIPEIEEDEEEKT